MQRLGEERGIRRGATGLVAATHLAGGSLNLNPHQHVIALDGVYSTSADGEHVMSAPAQSELRDVVERVDERVARWLARHRGRHDDGEPLSLRLGGYGHVADDGVAHDTDADHARFGMRKNTPWPAEHEGWSVHASVTMRAPAIRMAARGSAATCFGTG